MHLTVILNQCKPVMHSWYQLGNIYSSQCKDQTEFMTRLKELSKETCFKEPDELTKFLFVIHNTDSKVREYLIDKGDPSKTCTEFLAMARSVESMVKTETLSRELLGQVGKVPISSIDRGRGRGRGRGSRGRSHSRYTQIFHPRCQSSVADVEKSIHQGGAQHITKCVKGVKSKDTSNNIAKPKIQVGPTHPGVLGENNMKSQGELINHLAIVQGQTMSVCEDSIHFVFNKGTQELPSSSNIMFNEIS